MRGVATVSVLLAALTCGAAQAQSPNPDSGVVKPGGVRVTLIPPDKDKWDMQAANNGARRMYRCKPLACAEQETVYVTYQKSPTEHPDPKALERYATTELPKKIRAAAASRSVLSDTVEKIETLMSKPATIKNYPGVLNETKITRGKGHANYYYAAIIFAGPVMIHLESISPNRPFANKTLNEFLEVMTIVQGPPASPAAPAHGSSPRLQEL